jgi:hypothetical protein
MNKIRQANMRLGGLSASFPKWAADMAKLDLVEVTT